MGVENCSGWPQKLEIEEKIMKNIALPILYNNS